MPQPDGPTMEVKDSGIISRLILLSAGISLFGVLYAKEIPLSDNRGGDELVGRAFINNLLV